LGLSSGIKTAKIGRAELPNFYIFFVLAHPEYYPRFGFVPASSFGIRCEYDGVPDEAFMIVVLEEKGGLAFPGSHDTGPNLPTSPESSDCFLLYVTKH